MKPEIKIELTERITELLPGREVVKIGDGTVLHIMGTEIYIDLNIAHYERERNELETYIKNLTK